MEEEDAALLTANEPGDPGNAGSQALLNILQVDLDDE